MIIEMVIIALLVINIFTILLAFFSYRDIQNIRLLNQQTHGAMGTLVGRLLTTEQHVIKISQSVVELITFAENIMDNFEFDVTSEYRTPDGKHRASSMEELIEKVKNDSEKNSTEDFMDNLRNLFEQNMDDDDDDDEGFRK